RRPPATARRPSPPELASHVRIVAPIHSAPWSRDTSTSEGIPVRSRLNSAAATAAAPLRPPTQSPIPPGGGVGSVASGGVRNAAIPGRAQAAATSNPPVSALGPRGPYPLART